MKTMNITYFDLETTGTDTKTDRIVSMFAYNPRLKYKLSVILNPEIDIPEGASNVHGITNDMVKDKLVLENIKLSIKKIIESSEYLCGYNISKFDIPLLLTELKRVGIDIDLKDIKIIDLFYIVKKILTDDERNALPNLKLETIYKATFGKKLDAHEAEADTIACLELLKELHNNKHPWMSYCMDKQDVRGQDIYDVDYVLKFGKYQDSVIRNVITNDPKYLNFCIKRGYLSVNSDIHQLIQESITYENMENN